MANLSKNQKTELETIINNLIVASRFKEEAIKSMDMEGFDIFLADYYSNILKLDDKFGVKLPALETAKNYYDDKVLDDVDLLYIPQIP